MYYVVYIIGSLVFLVVFKFCGQCYPLRDSLQYNSLVFSVRYKNSTDYGGIAGYSLQKNK